MSSIYDRASVVNRLTAACQCMCRKKSSFNELMTLNDARKIFEEWARDDEKDDTYKLLCQTVLVLTDKDIVGENSKLQRQVKSLNDVTKSQAQLINKLDNQILKLKSDNSELRQTIKELKRNGK